MNIKRHLVSILLLATIAVAQAGTLLTFDDLPPGDWPAPGYTAIPDGYGGLNWNNFGVLDGFKLDRSYGYNAGVVSPNNVAFNLGGNTAYLSSRAGLFNVQSGYLTAALNLDTSFAVRVQGFLGSSLVFDHSYSLSRTAPSFVEFNCDGVDRVTFNSSPELQPFALDNLVVVVPEPSSGLLALGGGLTFFAARRLSRTRD